MIKGPHVSIDCCATIGRSSSSISYVCARAKTKMLTYIGAGMDGYGTDGDGSTDECNYKRPVKGFNKSRHTTHTFHINQSQQRDNKSIYKCNSISTYTGGFCEVSILSAIELLNCYVRMYD